jgi:hypothetical protein
MAAVDRTPVARHIAAAFQTGPAYALPALAESKRSPAQDTGHDCTPMRGRFIRTPETLSEPFGTRSSKEAIVGKGIHRDFSRFSAP